MSIEIRKSSVSVLTAVQKMKPELRPQQNDLYRFFGGTSDKLNNDQRKELARIIKQDSNIVISYLLKGVK